MLLTLDQPESKSVVLVSFPLQILLPIQSCVNYCSFFRVSPCPAPQNTVDTLINDTTALSTSSF